MEQKKIDRINELADHQQRGITGIVVDIFEPLVDDTAVVGGKHIDFVAVQLKHLFEHGEMHRQHLRHQQGIFPFHFFGKQQAPLLIIDEFCHTLCT